MTGPQRYRDRRHAGQQLAHALQAYAHRPDAMILALPRGGVPVAAEVAEMLGLPLDLLLVRKLGVPGHEELAMGAIASGPGGGTIVLNDPVVRQAGISQQMIEQIASEQRQELLRREQAYRGQRPQPELHSRCVIVIDDGLATGSTMLAAVQALRQYHPREIVIAVPVAPPETCQKLQRHVDQLVCPLQPDSFAGVGQWYDRFDQLTDEQVKQALAGR